jgi:HEPN domain-containing protein
MNSQEKFEYWLEIAQNDLNIAESMLIMGHWLFVAVQCQQAIEKLAKGLYTVYNNEDPPRIHNIAKLIKEFENKLPIKIDIDLYVFFYELSEYYINNRYPDFKNKLNALMNKNKAQAILTKTKEVFLWLLTLKP